MLTLSPSLVVTVELTGAGSGLLRFEQADEQLSLALVPFGVGPRGPSGGEFTVLAAEALGGHRAVTADGFHAEPEEANAVAGITLTSAATGASVVVVSSGLMQEDSWNWTPNLPVFFGASGVLTQTAPNAGLIRRIAWAITPTKINVDMMPPIVVAA